MSSSSSSSTTPTPTPSTNQVEGPLYLPEPIRTAHREERKFLATQSKKRGITFVRVDVFPSSDNSIPVEKFKEFSEIVHKLTSEKLHNRFQGLEVIVNLHKETKNDVNVSK